MDTSIIVVWWIALIIALILTLIVLKLVILVVRTERDILRLAHRTLPAARGIAANTALISKLETTKGVAGKILSVAIAIESVAASIEQKLRSVGRGLAERRL
jgi:sensor histidine kinase regulating citrate/malate metabolism